MPRNIGREHPLKRHQHLCRPKFRSRRRFARMSPCGVRVVDRIWVRDKVLRWVAQDCILPYRGFAVREAFASLTNADVLTPDRKSTRLNSSHLGISYAVFCL